MGGGYSSMAHTGANGVSTPTTPPEALVICLDLASSFIVITKLSKRTFCEIQAIRLFCTLSVFDNATCQGTPSVNEISSERF
ncbi:unnamed protein product [Litomosoides sigmodontis]|uniref:Uncharacterized protein n=1 Tax=Litomosoides sigmodontis TaxID=42156 RepID=A0A3P6TGB3_LITSI|nr:unnamed protein product [Litomosoides sigmodontis]